MTTRLTHLAINADDRDASRRFYAGVLGLDFAEYLGPEFLRAELEGLLVALQRRRHIGPIRPNGPECTFSVDDAQTVAERAAALGGRVLMAPTPVSDAGELAFVADPRDATSLVEIFDRAAARPEALAAMGAEGRRLCSERWNYETSFLPVRTRLREMVEDFAAAPAVSAPGGTG